MLLSTLNARWSLHLISVTVIFVGFMLVYYFMCSTSFKGNLAIVPKQKEMYRISTAHDASYMLYGVGESNTNTDESVHRYILSMTSRQTPGQPRLAGRPGKRHYSQIGQSQYVDKLLKGRRNGVFLECGAADGETHSNSLFFEIHRNWTGILIEANPTRLRSLIRRNRNAFVVRSCLSVTTKPQMARFTMPRGGGGGLSSSLESKIMKRFKIWSRSSVLPEIYVQCFPLTSILDALNVHHIDYLSLDVEGAEIEILKTVDWTKLTVDVLTIEYNLSVDKLRKIRSLFKNTSLYKEVRILGGGQDVVFVRV